MQPILEEQHDAAAWITLNRPARRNAINSAMLEALEHALRHAHDDPMVRVIVLSSVGPVFCAGDDLDELPASAAESAAVRATVTQLQEITRLIMLGRCPVICAVRGWAIGAGASWALNADLTLWSHSARLRFPEARHGLFASGGVTWLLPRLCGDQRALNILLGGEVLDAERLQALGIIESTLPDDELEAALHQQAEQWLALPPASLEAYKRVQAMRIARPLGAAMQAEADEMCAAVARLQAGGAFPEVAKA